MKKIRLMLKSMIVIAVIFCMAGNIFGQETVRGSIQFSSAGGKGSTAKAVITMPPQGVPNQIKVVISKRVSQGNEKNEQRYKFILPNSFTVADGNIIAAIGEVDAPKEEVKLFLVYRGASKEGKAAFSQVKVELSVR